MAEASSQMKVVSALSGFSNLSIVRQLLLMGGLAASIALGVIIVMWSQQPNYVMLYGGLSDQDSMDVTSALDRSGIPYKITPGSGTILVPGNRVHEARMNLAGQGLPKETANGFELLDKDQGFGVSQFMENARYQRALEGELAKTIGSMSNVQSARVHLAIPKQSEFVRNRKNPSASVLLSVYGGRQISDEQVAAIVHLVASSVSNLSPDRITVVDQTGKLLSSQQSSNSFRLTATQFDYRKKVEDYYTKQIEDIVSPILGSNGVRAQVSADVDFNQTEQTQESYNPDLPAVRSEQTYEDKSNGNSTASGIPGALSNQPPAVQTTNKQQGQSDVNPNSQPGQNVVRRVTRNYELDKTISHTNFQTGLIRKLSIAVVVDDRQSVDSEGTITRTPLTEDELKRITSLVKEAVGFNAERGDSVNVINASFAQPPVLEPPPAIPFYQKPWVWDIAKQVAAGVGVLLLVFGVLRPLLRSLVDKAPPPGTMVIARSGGNEFLSQQGAVEMGGMQVQGKLPGPNNYEQQLGAIKGMATQDPKRVAQVVKNWVSTDG